MVELYPPYSVPLRVLQSLRPWRTGQCVAKVQLRSRKPPSSNMLHQQTSYLQYRSLEIRHRTSRILSTLELNLPYSVTHTKQG